MKKVKNNNILKAIEKLSDSEKAKLIDSIMAMLSSRKGDSLSFSCNKMISEVKGEKPDCPHCHAEAKAGLVIKRGFSNGVQRFYCKKCKKTFVASTMTAFENTRKDADVWRKFIRLTITGATLHRCADECKINYRTSFIWRHKILNAFVVSQNKTHMQGIVEIDETFFKVSYKGNHVQGHFKEKRTLSRNAINDMPRPAFKRGSDNKSRAHSNRICVVCMVENGNRGFYGKAIGPGLLTNNGLDKTFAMHVDKENSLVLLDDAKHNTNYMEKNKYTFLPLKSNTTDNDKDHKVEVQGPYHIQHVNAMHSGLKSFIKKYNGVSSKYLQNYISLYVWLKNVALKQVDELREKSVARVSLSDCYITSKEIISAPSLPNCA